MRSRHIAIIGTVGVPARYGGFETLAENLVKFHESRDIDCSLTVYCSGKSYLERPLTFRSARLRYVPLKANGIQSIAYDIWSLVSAIWHGHSTVLLLGVSGAIALPVMRLISGVHIVTNLDGIEWRRDKWRGLAKWFLQISERMAIRYSHEVIADNAAIATYVRQSYRRECRVIAYGGDHATAVEAAPISEYNLPSQYALSICRIEPENNLHTIISAFSTRSALPLVIVGNWDGSEYGRRLRRMAASVEHVYLVDPIYDLGKLKTLRSGALFYIHGHSAGGTNPSLVEAMQFGMPVIAFDCDFNRETTEHAAFYFRDAIGLAGILAGVISDEARQVGRTMRDIAIRRYLWSGIASQYFELLDAPGDGAAAGGKCCTGQPR